MEGVGKMCIFKGKLTIFRKQWDMGPRY